MNKSDCKEYIGTKKFKDIDKTFHDNINKIIKMDIPPIDLIHHFPVFVGHVNLAKYLFIYDLYKKCYKLAGDIADVGTWKGSSFLFCSKLVKLFEPYSYTQVHAFDWFQGMKPKENDNPNLEGRYTCDYESLIELVDLQDLNNIAEIHKLDLSKELDLFFKNNPHLRFKMIYIDCGIENVIKESLKFFWPRLTKGGILMMDHYNLDISPEESKHTDQIIGDNLIKKFPFSRHPTAYIIKEK